MKSYWNNTEKKNKRRKTDNRRKNYRRMSQISESEIEDIMIEIHKMNLNKTKDVNPVTPQFSGVIFFNSAHE